VFVFYLLLFRFVDFYCYCVVFVFFVLILKPTRCNYFSNLFSEWNSSNSTSVHHKEFFTVNTAMVYVIKICCVCTVKNPWWWTEELPETCRVYSKNKLDELLHLVGFTIRIYSDARSPERQNVFLRWLYNWLLCCWLCTSINAYSIELNPIIIFTQILLLFVSEQTIFTPKVFRQI